MAILRIKHGPTKTVPEETYQEVAPFLAAPILSSIEQPTPAEVVAIAMSLFLMLPNNNDKSQINSSQAWKITALQNALR